MTTLDSPTTPGIDALFDSLCDARLTSWDTLVGPPPACADTAGYQAVLA